MLHRKALLIAFAVAPVVAGEGPPALTFEEIVRRSLADPSLVARSAELARLEREVVATGPVAREGPTLEAEVGPRRSETGASGSDVTARLEVPLLTGRDARARIASELRDGGRAVVAAEAVESRLRLRLAYLDAWAGQERLDALLGQADAVGSVLASIRKRVDEGADAPYEAALVEGELLRLRSDADVARAVLGDAWIALRRLADLPPAPQRVAAPPPPDLELTRDVASRFERGALRAAVERKRSLGAAALDFEQAERRSRWSVGGSAGKEGEESFATLGVGYRFRRPGEAEAGRRERDVALAALMRGADADAAGLETRFEVVMDRARHFGPLVPPESFDDALRAVTLRIELGKDRPSEALPIRRQLQEARSTAVQRVRDASAVIAEVEALTAGGLP